MHPQLNTVDIVALVLIVLGALNGLRRGLAGELAGMVGVTFAAMFALLVYQPWGEWFADRTVVSVDTALALAFLAAVLGPLLLLLVLRLLFRETVSISVTSKRLDLPLGLVAGFVKSFILVMVVLLCVNLWPNKYLSRVFGTQSVLGRTAVRLMPDLHEEVEAAAEIALPDR